MSSIPPPGSADPVLERAVVLLRGMAYEHRLHILMMLRDGEQTPASFARAIPAEPTAVAHHLRYLLDSRLIARRRRGRQFFYRLRSEEIGRLVGEVLHCAGEPG